MPENRKSTAIPPRRRPPGRIAELLPGPGGLGAGERGHPPADAGGWSAAATPDGEIMRKKKLAARRQSRPSPGERANNKMKMICVVNQVRALELGVDAPHSSVSLEVTPSDLSPAVRGILAEKLSDGHRLDDLGPICPPTIEGMIARAEEILRGRAEEAARIAATPAREEAEAREVLREKKTEISVTSDGVEYPIAAWGYYAPAVVTQSPEATEWQRELDEQKNIATEKARAVKAAAAAVRAAAEAAAIASAAERLETYRRIIREHGARAQVARLDRGLMESPREEATAILGQLAFGKISLPVAILPTEEDVEMGEYSGEDIPEIERTDERAGSLTDDQMTRYLSVESAIRSAIPDAVVVPWAHQITRHHDNIPWSDPVVVGRATVTREGIELVRDYAI